jgi:hypothetical protein
MCMPGLLQFVNGVRLFVGLTWYGPFGRPAGRRLGNTFIWAVARVVVATDPRACRSGPSPRPKRAPLRRSWIVVDALAAAGQPELMVPRLSSGST